MSDEQNLGLTQTKFDKIFIIYNTNLTLCKNYYSYDCAPEEKTIF